MNTPSSSSRPGEYLVPPQARIVQCKSCQAPIVWTRTSKNGRPIPLSMATVRTDELGARYALNHFADCPHADQHRGQGHPEPTPQPAALDLRDLPAYLDRHGLVVVRSTVTDNGNGRLIVELQTRKVP